ncbi:S4 domain-containing protein YaaA [Gracilibacillus alcaliphilus]|uniref:S4 domain-containing protein YaaA n=1 Tax=Gracilibacillus alcaliphilus TaxID=1401441 RepID=UPI001958230E|nr:S4 domain-containing protein YaaA [Gracilibacillus alcaliphilus]MBM7678731.1 S4 domain protein YaaA [Gracilibacillus alcaliphilus]
MKETIHISTEYIPLGQFLKLANILESGGMIKVFLQENGVYVNDELETRRGRKLYPGDMVYVEDAGTFVVESLEEDVQK